MLEFVAVDFEVSFVRISIKPLNLSLKVSKTITFCVKQYCTENRSFGNTFIKKITKI